ncbi:MAG TPA: BPL-N domain-containing protein [Dissulfurispiraceae bacterium]|nr:BPL-N domain-containing protein [Dissulfurispiraceae bacterium]
MKKAALLWDESFLWGLMACRALSANGLPFDLIRSEDIKRGCLSSYGTIFVPGGWASNKIRRLGKEGTDALRKFVGEGGNYLGFCGGAGLATLDGIGLLAIGRKPTKNRVPSFSGRVYLNLSDHPIWEGLTRENAPSSLFHETPPKRSGLRSLKDDPSSPFHVWWPSQFVLQDETITILASYRSALPDAFSSDLNVGDVNVYGNWQDLENLYQIRLDPQRLSGAPVVVGGKFGKGAVLLSLVHFDTPGDAAGSAVLRNIWKYFGIPPAEHRPESGPFPLRNEETADQGDSGGLSDGITTAIRDIDGAVTDIIDLGLRNFLWFWRNPMLLQWRRGIRGLEYCTLFILVREIARILENVDDTNRVNDQGNQRRCAALHIGMPLAKRLESVRALLLPFSAQAQRLLVLERLALQNGHITYEKCNDEEIQQLRAALFSESKSYGGAFKKLLDEIDDLLYILLAAGSR